MGGVYTDKRLALPGESFLLTPLPRHERPVNVNLNQVTLPASDLENSVSFYLGMGFKQIVQAPGYARFECPEGDSTLSLELAPELTSGAGAIIYFECQDLDATVTKLRSRGYVFDRLPRDEQWLWREARLTDPAGTRICLFWAGQMRKFPPWRISSRTEDE